MAYSPSTLVSSLSADGGGQKEQSYASASADLGAFEKFTAVLPAVASLAQADYIHFVNKTGTKYAVWADIDANGTPPTGALYVAADQKIEVDVTTGQTAADVAQAFKTAIEADMDFDEFTIGIVSATLTFTSSLLGDLTNAVSKNADDSTAGSITVAVTVPGADSSLQSKYFTFRNASNSEFYVWFNVNSEGVDPSPGGTGLEVALTGGESASGVASAAAAVIDSESDFEAESDGAAIKITNAAVGSASDIGSGDSGFSVSNQAQGSATILSPATLVSSLTNV